QSLLPDGGVLGFGYDRHGLFTQVSHNGDVLASIERDQDGRELRRRQGAAESRYDYDVMGRLTRHRVSHRQSKARIIERSYGYDASGNLALIDDLKKGTTHYRYDALDRLKTVEGYCNEEFAFDPAGNILDGQNQAKGNRLNFHGDRHFEYDAAGNLILEKRGKGGKLETRYQYNKQNQLVAIEKDGQKTEYQYDALGRRIAKQDAFGKTEFLWNGDVLLSEQRNHLNKVYVYEPNSFRPLAFIQDKQVYHYHLDHLGTPQEMTNAEGEVVWSARYKAYGNLALQDIEEVQNPLRFQGQYYDEETGLHYNRHRYYDPSAARFINQDPVGLLGGDNNYQYAPNPTGWVDPFGLTCKELTQEEIDQLKELVLNDPDRAYYKIREMIRSDQLDFSTKKDGAVFWGTSRHPGVNNMLVAQTWAKANGKSTLEQTSGGKVLEQLDLFSKSNDMDSGKAAKLWNMASTKFASNASGDINVFNTGANRFGQWGERTWWRIEKPVLLKNESVTSVARRKKDGSAAKTGHIVK
ncbi:RHS domain-containing protein, partial [Hahella sp. CR1]|uniref:RHS repeat-associated core domain-containing protein n=1 Tax=Hahella sp. CR1 TaxID=2992807 RepID=UPI0024415090